MKVRHPNIPRIRKEIASCDRESWLAAGWIPIDNEDIQNFAGETLRSVEVDDQPATDGATE